MDDEGKPEIGRQSLGDRAPAVAMVVAAQHADPGPLRPAAVILHVQPAGDVPVAGDLVDALAELRVGIGEKAGADALVGRPERPPAVLAQVVAAGRDSEVHALALPHDGVHAESPGPRLPLPGMLVIADPGNHLPAVPGVAAPEQRCRLDAAPDLVLGVPGFH